MLEALLRLLGVPGPRVPRGLEARVAAYRDRLAGLRVLVVLDNAADSEQVQPLVADSPGSLTLVTSRRAARRAGGRGPGRGGRLHSAGRRRLSRSRRARGRDRADARALARIAEQYGFLPLALGVVAGHIRAQPGWTLTDHADRLDVRHDERRLDSAVELSLDLSYRHLPRAEQQLLRQLALHPGQDFDGYAAAALSAYEMGLVRRHLRKLSDDNLLQCLAPGRYTFHDLVRAYAAARADDEEPPSGQRAALTRLFDNYLATAASAADTVYPDDVYRRPRIAAPGTPMPEFDSPDTALAWLETERPNLVAIAGHTLAHGWLTHTTRLSGTLKNYLDSGHFTDALTVHGQAIRAAAATGDQHRHASALASSGIAYLRLARYEAAADYFRQALVVARRAGEHRIEASARGNLALVEQTLSRFREANEHKEQALALYRQAGDRIGEAAGLVGLADIAIKLGRFVPAEDHLQQALTLFRQIGHRRGEAWARDSFGTLHTHLGRRDLAVEHHQQALAIFRAAADHEGETSALIGLGEAARAADNLPDALTHHTGALSIAVEIGDRFLQARAHTSLGHDHYAVGDTVRAQRHYRAAAALNSGLDP
ncbi:MAG: tetratricopeptide repeat protein [Actinoplanes sp.]